MLEQDEIFDLDTKKWYKIKRLNGLWGKGLRVQEQVYVNVTKFPTGNHLYFSEAKGLHYKKRSPPPPSPQPKKILVGEEKR